MTDDTTTSAPESGAATAGNAPASVPAPAPTPATNTTEQTDDLDLLGDDGEDDGTAADDGVETDAPADEPDTERPAWQRPDGLDGDALIDWKEAQGLPTDPDGYTIDLKLGEGEQVTEVGQQLLAGLKQFGVENDMPEPALNGLANWYNDQLKALQAKFAESDKALRTETRNVLTQKWAGAYDHRMEVVKAGARLLPQGLRAALKVARTPDGRRVSDTPEFAEALLAIGRLTTKGKQAVTSDDQRRADIEKIMNTDIDRYNREGLGQEYLALARKRDATPVRTVTLSPAEAAEELELLQHMSEDVGAYQHRQWRGSGKTGSDRLLELRRKRAGEAA
jgi:hypothetical protein